MHPAVVSLHAAGLPDGVGDFLPLHEERRLPLSAFIFNLPDNL